MAVISFDLCYTIVRLSVYQQTTSTTLKELMTEQQKNLTGHVANYVTRGGMTHILNTFNVIISESQKPKVIDVTLYHITLQIALCPVKNKR